MISKRITSRAEMKASIVVTMFVYICMGVCMYNWTINSKALNIIIGVTHLMLFAEID